MKTVRELLEKQSPQTLAIILEFMNAVVRDLLDTLQEKMT